MNDLEQPGDTEPRPPNPWAKPGCVTLRCREDGPLVIELPGPEAGPVQAVRVIDQVVAGEGIDEAPGGAGP